MTKNKLFIFYTNILFIFIISIINYNIFSYVDFFDFFSFYSIYISIEKYINGFSENIPYLKVLFATVLMIPLLKGLYELKNKDLFNIFNEFLKHSFYVFFIVVFFILKINMLTLLISFNIVYFLNLYPYFKKKITLAKININKSFIKDLKEYIMDDSLSPLMLHKSIFLLISFLGFIVIKFDFFENYDINQGFKLIPYFIPMLLIYYIHKSPNWVRFLYYLSDKLSNYMILKISLFLLSTPFILTILFSFDLTFLYFFSFFCSYQILELYLYHESNKLQKLKKYILSESSFILILRFSFFILVVPSCFKLFFNLNENYLLILNLLFLIFLQSIFVYIDYRSGKRIFKEYSFMKNSFLFTYIIIFSTIPFLFEQYNDSVVEYYSSYLSKSVSILLLFVFIFNFFISSLLYKINLKNKISKKNSIYFEDDLNNKSFLNKFFSKIIYILWKSFYVTIFILFALSLIFCLFLLNYDFLFLIFLILFIIIGHNINDFSRISFSNKKIIIHTCLMNNFIDESNYTKIEAKQFYLLNLISKDFNDDVLFLKEIEYSIIEQIEINKEKGEHLKNINLIKILNFIIEKSKLKNEIHEKYINKALGNQSFSESYIISFLTYDYLFRQKQTFLEINNLNDTDVGKINNFKKYILPTFKKIKKYDLKLIKDKERKIMEY